MNVDVQRVTKIKPVVARQELTEPPAAKPGKPVKRAAPRRRLICVSACRQFLLDMAHARYPGKFKRVDPETYDDMEAAVRAAGTALVKSLPCKGKTIRK